jgi:hypothetical protein
MFYLHPNNASNVNLSDIHYKISLSFLTLTENQPVTYKSIEYHSHVKPVGQISAFDPDHALHDWSSGGRECVAYRESGVSWGVIFLETLLP